MGAKITTIIALVVAFVTFLLMSIATGSTHWMKAGTSHSGLFASCYEMNDESICADIDFDLNDTLSWMKTVQAFCILAILTLIVGFILAILDIFMESIKPKFSAIVFFISAFWQLIAMAVYADETNTDNGGSYGWAYGIGWAAFVYPIAAGIIELLGEFY
uniref:Peripheral myelin protein 22 n=1 Tax=Clytia hemisphaerica TaxID=252671 RepID=A0A7M5X3D1_9CNID|eukprot:TCONS_00022556-protein